jgi:hypothetical protein
MPSYQTRLAHLCDQASREVDQGRLLGLLNQIIQLLAENQKGAGEVLSPHCAYPSTTSN